MVVQGQLPAVGPCGAQGCSGRQWPFTERCPLFPQSEDRSVLFAVASTLVNCSNSYDHEEPDPQMLELAKYAKQHVPQQHPKVREQSRPWGWEPGPRRRGAGRAMGGGSLEQVGAGGSTGVGLGHGRPRTGPDRPVPLDQDKPDFVRRRVQKLLAAGVVSALACMVKSETPALTSSCRELISR